jgi:hypothetical protein
MRSGGCLILPLALCLVFAPAHGQGVAMAHESQLPPPARAPDLDFTDDFPAPSQVPIKRAKRARSQVPRKSAPPVEAPREEPSTRWVWWTLGTLGFTAAAGGAAWYIHSVSEDGPAPLRNDQVFSDGP